jgi:regulator of replication initiation timing
MNEKTIFDAINDITIFVSDNMVGVKNFINRLANENDSLKKEIEELKSQLGKKEKGKDK